MAKKKYLLVSCILQVIDGHLVFGRFFFNGDFIFDEEAVVTGFRTS